MLYGILAGIGVLGLLGYFVVKHVEAGAAKLGQGLANSLAGGATVTTVSIDSATSQGSVGQFGLTPGEGLVLNVYSAPAGYAWKFDGGGVLVYNAAASTPMSASFTAPPVAPTAPFTVYASLVKSGATVAPMAIYSFTMQISPTGAAPAAPPPAPADTAAAAAPAAGVAVGKQSVIAISQSTPKGAAATAPVPMGPNDTLAVRVYAPPTGYQWLFNSDNLTPAPLPPLAMGLRWITMHAAPGSPQLSPSALFTVPAGVTAAVVTATLVHPAHAGLLGALAPIAIYTFPVVVQ